MIGRSIGLMIDSTMDLKVPLFKGDLGGSGLARSVLDACMGWRDCALGFDPPSPLKKGEPGNGSLKIRFFG
jgi:hypothetical protein